MNPRGWVGIGAGSLMAAVLAGSLLGGAVWALFEELFPGEFGRGLGMLFAAHSPVSACAGLVAVSAVTGGICRMPAGGLAGILEAMLSRQKVPEGSEAAGAAGAVAGAVAAAVLSPLLISAGRGAAAPLRPDPQALRGTCLVLFLIALATGAASGTVALQARLRRA